MILLIYGCLVVVVDCWAFTREISSRCTRKCLEMPDYYRKSSYDTHTRIVNIYNVSSYRIGIHEKTYDIVTFTIIINLSYFTIFFKFVWQLVDMMHLRHHNHLRPFEIPTPSLWSLIKSKDYILVYWQLSRSTLCNHKKIPSAIILPT